MKENDSDKCSAALLITLQRMGTVMIRRHCHILVAYSKLWSGVLRLTSCLEVVADGHKGDEG